MGKTYIIAEAGVNHNGSLKLAMQLVEVAAQAGADAVKFQTFKAEQLVSRAAPKAEYQLKSTDPMESQLDMIKQLELTKNDHRLLIDYCTEKGIEFLSSPFDLESVGLLAGTFNLSRLKIPSGEITNAPLLLKAAQTGKPIILSTGMSNLGEIETALGVLAFGYTEQNKKPSLDGFEEAYQSKKGQAALQNNVILLHCVTQYPTPYEYVNLKAMDTLHMAFNLPVGYSDHTMGIAVPIAAVARGAVIIEKHFTLDRNFAGPDHKASLEPGELAELVKSIRFVEKALGGPLKIPYASEVKNKIVARKSLVATKDIVEGEVFSKNNIGAKRPFTGLSPIYFWDLLGQKATRNFKQDEVIDI